LCIDIGIASVKSFRKQRIGTLQNLHIHSSVCRDAAQRIERVKNAVLIARLQARDGDALGLYRPGPLKHYGQRRSASDAERYQHYS
jgi:hypothetical protein